jgi:hypothetical protein
VSRAVFASFLEELEARTAIARPAALRRAQGDGLGALSRQVREARGEWRVAHRTLVFGDMLTEPVREPLRFAEGFTEQKHGMSDPLYASRTK